MFGVFTGNGALRQDITLGFKPSHVILFRLFGGGTTAESSVARSITITPTDLSKLQDGTYVSKTYNVFKYFSMAGYFAPNKNIYHDGCPSSYYTVNADVLFDRGHGGAAVTSNGFAVGYNANGRSDINESNTMYFYIALK